MRLRYTRECNLPTQLDWLSGIWLRIFLLLISSVLLRAQTLQWSGASNGNWDIGSTTNWLSGATPVVFTNGANVFFGDAASGTTGVIFTTNLQPASVVVSNTTKSYTLGGAGYISGAAGFVKQGTNLLTLSGSNTFTGAFIISNGIVTVTNLANGGLPSAIGASSSSASNLKLAGGTFSYRGNAAQIDRGYLVAGSSTLDVQGDLALSGAISATTGTFFKIGAAKLSYNGTGLNQLTANSGKYQVGAGTAVFDGTAGAANNCSGELWVGYNQINNAALILTNTIFTNASWLAIARGNGAGGLTSTATFYNSAMVCTNVSLGFANGVPGNNQTGSLTLNGNSRLANGGNFNLSESGGSTCSVTINDNSWIYSLNRVLVSMANGATGSVTIANSGAFTNAGYVSIGANGVGFATLKNNAVWQSLTDFNVADTSGSQGTLTVQDSAKLIISTLYAGKAANSTGTVYQAGGTVSNNGGSDWRIGGNTSGAANQLGIYYLSNGVFNAGNNFQVGAYGTGYFNQSGGTATIGAYPSIGRFSGSVGYLNVSGGTFNQSGSGQNLIIGEQGAGTLNVSATGLVNCAGNLVIGNSAGGSGAVNLNGGTVIAKRVLMNSTNATSTINFNGGTLRAGPGASASFLDGLTSATIQSGGAIIDSSTNAITIAQDLYDGGLGNLTKLGAGTLTLSGNLYYGSATTVSAGKLFLPTLGAYLGTSGVVVSDGAGFGVQVTQPSGQVNLNSLSLGVAVGSTLDFGLGNFGNPGAVPLYVAGTFTVNGTTVVNVTGSSLIVGQFPLVRYGTRAGSGNFVVGSLPAGMVAQIITNVPNQSIDLVVIVPSSGLSWQMKQAALMTDWAQQVNPTNVLPEYPRPQMQRTNWMNLNGIWEWQAGSAGDPLPTNHLAGTILVPFCIESAISGVMELHDRAWYERTFSVPTNWAGQHVLLHFDAVDWECEPFLNGVSLGLHQGGYDPFTFDITAYLTNSSLQKLIVRIYDPTDAAGYPRGKQSLYPGGIMYTPCSGIWQPVWLEPVPATSISSFHLVPDIDNHRLLVNVGVSGPTNNISVSAVAFDGTNQIATATSSPGTNFYLNIPSPKLWSPTNPFLYDLQLTLKTNSTALDSVASYFGMRKVSLGTNNGFVKMFLNNAFMFEFGPLDQGFWPDGIYTAPTDLALKYDIESDKAMGFNFIRKHIKVERQRWYYWADKLGVVVWQDMPSVNSYTGSPQTIATNQFEAELVRMVTNHWNSPAIISWVIFNEGQGQHDTVPLVAEVKALDSSRLVNQASGNDWYGVGDIKDVHSYPNPGVPGSTTQSVACGEFGGVGLGITNHTWAAGWGYVGATDGTNLTSQFEGFCGLLSGFITDNGLSAAVYTQITDVETELNGLNTYDRKVYKPILRRMQTAITSLMGQYSNTVVVPNSQTTGQAWKYTFTSPAANWFTNTFNDSAWTNGTAGFGTAGTPGAVVNTTWNTADIWMRRTFNPGALTLQQITNLVFSVIHDEGCEIYINGVLAASATGYVTAYGHLAMNTAGQNAIVPNANNLLAVHCHQTSGGQDIDVGIDITTVITPPPPVFIPNWVENGAGLTAEYFNDTNLASRVFTRTDTNVNFNWGSGSPGGGLSSNQFSVRWSGKIQPRYSEGCMFHLTTDDGCRLWVNGQLLIDKWHDDTNTDATGSIALTGGQRYDLRIEYYDNTNVAAAKLEWNSASQSREVVPQGVLFPSNIPPVLAAISNATLTAGQTLLVTNNATDADVPAQMLTWSLPLQPAGASINSSNGLLTWRPAIAQSPSTNPITVMVTDSGTPSLNATQSFNVVVLKPATPVFSSAGIVSGKFQTAINGSVGPDYSIYSTTNLQDSWQLLFTTNPVAMPFSFVDPAYTNYSQRYYRVLLGP